MTELDPTHNLAAYAEQLQQLVAQGVATHGLTRAISHFKKEAAIADANRLGRHNLATNPPELQPGLHVGCGANIITGFTNLDIFPNPGVDVVCDAREGLPFPTGQFKTVFSEHMLEHVDYPVSTKKIVSEMVRVTEPGGLVVIGVPDASIPVRAYAAGDTNYFDDLRDRWYSRRSRLDDYTEPMDFVRLVFGDEDDDPVYTPHLWAYDQDSLTGLMQDAGLTNILPWEFDPAMSLEKRQWGSVYLQGVKPSEDELA